MRVLLSEPAMVHETPHFRVLAPIESFAASQVGPISARLEMLAGVLKDRVVLAAGARSLVEVHLIWIQPVRS